MFTIDYSAMVAAIWGPLSQMIAGKFTEFYTYVSNQIKDLVSQVMTALGQFIAEKSIMLFEYIARGVMKIVETAFFTLVSDLLLAAVVSPALMQNGFIIKASNAMQVFGLSLLVLMASYYGFKTYFQYFGFETEEPWKIMARVAGATLMIAGSIDICTYALQMFSGISQQVLNAFGVANADGTLSEETFRQMGFKMIFDENYNIFEAVIETVLFFYLVYKTIWLVPRFAERYIIIIMLVIFSPLAMACSVAKPTRDIFRNWHRALTGNLMAQVLQVACFAAIIGITINPPPDFKMPFAKALLCLGCLTFMENTAGIINNIMGVGAASDFEGKQAASFVNVMTNGTQYSYNAAKDTTGKAVTGIKNAVERSRDKKYIKGMVRDEVSQQLARNGAVDFAAVRQDIAAVRPDLNSTQIKNLEREIGKIKAELSKHGLTF